MRHPLPACLCALLAAVLAQLVAAGAPAAAEGARTRIAAWPPELDGTEVPVKLDAWPMVPAPLEIDLAPGQTVRLDAEPPAEGIDAAGRHWRFSGWAVQEGDGVTPLAPEPGDPTVASFTAGSGPPAALRMVFADAAAPPTAGPAPAPAGPAPAPPAGAPVVPGADAKGFAVGADLVGGDQLDRVKRLGASWVRFDLSWRQVQPTLMGGYHWEPYDAFVGALGARGLVPLPILTDTPEWARNAAGAPDPVQFGAYANFAAEAVRHFPGIRIWEVWNEPNHGAFWPGGNGRDYARLLNTASAAIHGADPAALVIGGALAAMPDAGGVVDPVTFLRDMYRAGAGPNMNAVSVHPYCYWQAGSCPGTAANWAKAFGASNSVRRVMDDNGDAGKALWVTEMGAASRGGPGGYGAADPIALPEDQQAAQLTAAYDAFRAVRGPKGPLFWYRPADTCADPGNNECFYGVLRADGSDKPAAAAYRAVSPAGQADLAAATVPEPAAGPAGGTEHGGGEGGSAGALGRGGAQGTGPPPTTTSPPPPPPSGPPAAVAALAPPDDSPAPPPAPPAPEGGGARPAAVAARDPAAPPAPTPIGGGRRQVAVAAPAAQAPAPPPAPAEPAAAVVARAEAHGRRAVTAVEDLLARFLLAF